MPLFSSNKKETNQQRASVAAKLAKSSKTKPAKKASDGRHHMVLKAPWLSEKALIGTENGVYVFEVPKETTKYEIADAVEAIYKVTPRQIRVVNLPGKKKPLRTRRGFGKQAARHKAYVYLKKGDTIQLV
jgi:large subunit ribosomal protein L23